jgi:hypothetical protein
MVKEIETALYVNESKKKGKKRKQVITVCNYGTYPINNPMNIDDYDFDFQKSFLDKLVDLNEHIQNDGEKLIIENIQATSPKIFMRDILTQYTVKNIFDSHTQNKLIHIINKIMRTMYDQFYKKTKIRLYFIYRGGNILKMYKSSFEKILPGNARKIFEEEFDQYFKNSDIDFYNVIEDYKKYTEEELVFINSYLQMMSYYGAYVARIFIMNNFDLFNYCRANTIALSEDFQKLLNKMNQDKKDSEVSEVKKSNFIGLGFNEFMFMQEGYDLDKILNLPKSKIIDEFIHNVEDISVFENYKKFKKSGRYDINISPKEDNVEVNPINYEQNNLFKADFSKFMKELVEKNKIFDYYITNNNEIYNKEEYVDFSLVRLMINYVVVYERKGKYGLTNTSSELFDLSIGHPEDKNYSVYTPDTIVPYKFEYEEGLEDEIYIPAIHTTIVDLTNILYQAQDFPWQDAKYVKRLYRLMILVFVEQISSSTLVDIEKILKSKSKRKYKDIYDTTFETLLYRNEEIKKKLPTKYKKEFKEYIERYEEIISKLLNVVNKLKKFVNAKHQIKEEEIYEFL